MDIVFLLNGEKKLTSEDTGLTLGNTELGLQVFWKEHNETGHNLMY